MLKRLWEYLSFDRSAGEFELLETESGERQDVPSTQQERAEPKLSASLAANEERLKHEFRTDINKDVVLRRFMLGGTVEAMAVYMNGMAGGELISEFVLREGMREGVMQNAGAELAEYALLNVFTTGEAELSAEWSDVKQAILEGRTAVIIDGDNQAVLMETRGYANRGVQPPQSERVVKGPHEGFNESLRTNITLLRRMINSTDLVSEIRETGADNNTKLAILYREGVANIQLVEEVKRKLAKIDTRVILNNGVIEQLTERHTFALLPQVLSTERPDRAASLIMQGHVAVLLDGSPNANIMPATLFMLMSSPEDIYMRQPQGFFLRLVRYLGAIVSLILPAYFIALATFHQSLMSTEVLTTIIASRKMVFMPIALEMVLLLFVFQLIREAGSRVPGTFGQSIGIIGGLLLGQAAVSANLASSVILIVVALTGLGNFCIPDYSSHIAASLLRSAFFIAAWMAGFLGLFSALAVFMAWLCSLKSYGVPFLAPFSPVARSDRPAVLRGRIGMRKRALDISNTVEGVRP